MTSRVNQQAVLTLIGDPGSAVVNQQAVMVLWGVSSEAYVNNLNFLVLSSFPRKRIIGITD